MNERDEAKKKSNAMLALAITVVAVGLFVASFFIQVS